MLVSVPVDAQGSMTNLKLVQVYPEYLIKKLGLEPVAVRNLAMVVYFQPKTLI